MKGATRGSILGREVEIRLFDTDDYETRDPDHQPANLPTIFGTIVQAIPDERDPAWRCYLVQLKEPLSLDRAGIEPEWRHITTSYLLLETWAATSYEGYDIIAEELLQRKAFQVLVGAVVGDPEKLPARFSLENNVEIWPSVCDGIIRLVE